MLKQPEISIVVPVYNEAGNLPLLHDSLTSVFRDARLSYEIVMVNDGSTDLSYEVIQQLNAKDPNVYGLSFSRNFGHMIALSAGLDFARGQAVITMDADMQHPPELIPQLVAKWQNGAKVVNTVRTETKKAGFFKRCLSKLFYRLMNTMAKIDMPENAADYRLLDREVVDVLQDIKERARFLRGLVCWVGFSQESVYYTANERYSGETSYSVRRMISFAIDGITSFSSVPLRFASYLGLFTTLVAFFYICYALIVRLFTERAITGWTSILVAILFIGGIQLICLGVMGEYLGRIFEETKARPLYIINKRIGFDEALPSKGNHPRKDAK